jgi:hypothetical protein
LNQCLIFKRLFIHIDLVHYHHWLYVSQISNKLKKYKYANVFKFVIIYLIPITISLKEIVLFATNWLTTQCNWLAHAIAKGCMCNYIWNLDDFQSSLQLWCDYLLILFFWNEWLSCLVLCKYIAIHTSSRTSDYNITTYMIWTPYTLVLHRVWTTKV